MNSGHKILRIAEVNLQLQNQLSQELVISNLLARLLVGRGISTVKEAQGFLSAKLDQLLDPHSFSDMPKAVGLIHAAAKNKQKVMIFGDYDVDGVTSIALIKKSLSRLGIQPLHYIPHRIKEGYGLNKDILNIVKGKGIKLLITADCGINSHEQIRELRRRGIEVILTDHHEPSHKELPSASAVINPKVAQCKYKYRDLAGVGVAYKLCQAFSGEKLFDDLDLVTLGTIADVVPLTGENRVIVKEGLKRISSTKKAGLRALMETSGIKNKKFNPTFVSFILGPRLNASGRIDSAETALSLLMSEEADEASRFAGAIEGYNRQRQKIESKIMEEAQDLIAKEVNFKEHNVIVVAKEDWHQGVLGIVAAKLSDKFYRPTILISKGSRMCKGSGRSIKNFHLFNALLGCEEYLDNFGGHEHAAGLVIERDNIEPFKNRINSLAKDRLRLEDLLPSIEVDMELSFEDINEESVRELQLLEPFGAGNPEPAFYTTGLKLKSEPQLLSRDTLKFWVTDGKQALQAIGFGMGRMKESLLRADSFSLVYSPRIDSWQGEESIILEIKEIFFGRGN